MKVIRVFAVRMFLAGVDVALAGIKKKMCDE
jgi:hypothetical protein